MKKIIILTLIMSLSTYSLAITWPFGSSGSITKDFVVKNPEKFAQGQLIKQFLDKAANYCRDVIKELKKPGFTTSPSSLPFIERNLIIIDTMQPRLARIVQRLNHETGTGYYGFMQRKYFQSLDNFTDKTTDPSNLLNKKYPNFIYRYLSVSLFGGKKKAEDVRAMSSEALVKKIDELIGKLSKKEETYAMLLREIRSFFTDELGKEEYDAFVDGRTSLDRLTIKDNVERETLKKQVEQLYKVIPQIKATLEKIQRSLKKE